MTPRHILLAGGLMIAAWLALFGNKTPANAVVESIPRPAVAKAAPPAFPDLSKQPNKIERVSMILALQPRATLIGESRDKQRDELFSSQSWAPPPALPAKPAPPLAPSAPPVPFTYLGKKTDGSGWEVYLARGDRTFIVQEQSVIDNEYRIDSIKPPALTLTYLPLQQAQTLTIGGTD